MLRDSLRAYFDAGNIDSPSGRAIVEERYLALRRQVPIIYILAVVNVCGLELGTSGRLHIGLNVPTVLAVCAVVRIVQWLRSQKDVTHAAMLKRMRQTCWLAGLICLTVCFWCLHLLQIEDRFGALAVILFGGLTAIGVSYGLSALPAAARLPVVVLALPLAGVTILSRDPQLVGAALSLVFVSALILRLIDVHNAHFTDVIRSRSTIRVQQELAEKARQEATVAATTDFLTGLPNRRAFVAAVDAEIEKAGKLRRSFAVAVVDIDRFKVVNDTFGHVSGDMLLEIVAQRLVRGAGNDGLVARLGGDEFGILFPNVSDALEARSIGCRILAEVNRPATINERQFAVHACCGFGISRHGKSRTPSRVLADADLALYEAKDRAADGIAVFESRMEGPRRRRAQIERALHSPYIHEKISLVFQPIIDLRDGHIVANEALARWTDDELGQVSPSEFVPIAEQLNVIGNISEHLMRKALIEAATWPRAIRLSFNLSAVQLCAAGSADEILAALSELEFPTHRLQVEVTETALLVDFESARENLSKLREAGVTIVLDDFGAGYASIGYLKELRFDQIKLDGGLVTAAEKTGDGERLLAAVIGLCQALGVAAVAEHVESEQQLELLTKLGCAAGQGHWLKSPMSAERCREFSQSVAVMGRHIPPSRKSHAA